MFGARLHGESKLDSDGRAGLRRAGAGQTDGTTWCRCASCCSRWSGSIGLFVHLVALDIALDGLAVAFAKAQALAAILAMTSNFILNNFLTYRDQRLKGRALLRGLLLFYLVCGVGLLANVGVAFSVYDQRPIWWLAGAAGALMGVVWNYAMSGLFVWRKR